MKIILYGDFGRYELGASYLRAFDSLRCEVSTLDRRNRSARFQPWLTTTIGEWASQWGLWMRRIGAGRWNKHLIKQCRQVEPDYVFILKGNFIMPETVDALRSLSRGVLHFHPDSPFPSAPSHRPETLPMMKQCDHCLIWSQSLRDRMCNEGMKTTYLPFAWDPSVFRRQERPNSWEHEVLFIGNWDKKRERILNRVAEHFNLKVWGSEYWQTHTSPGSPVQACWQGGGLFGEEASRAIVESKITLNILRDQNCPDGTNMRTFEIPGAGGFALATATTGAKEIFPEGEAGAYFDDVDDLVEKINYYLEHSQKREKIAAAARNVVQDHTYERRAKEILSVANGLKSEQP